MAEIEIDFETVKNAAKILTRNYSVESLSYIDFETDDVDEFYKMVGQAAINETMLSAIHTMIEIEENKLK